MQSSIVFVLCAVTLSSIVEAKSAFHVQHHGVCGGDLPMALLINSIRAAYRRHKEVMRLLSLLPTEEPFRSYVLTDEHKKLIVEQEMLLSEGGNPDNILDYVWMLSPYITPCTRSNLEECVLLNAEAIKPHLGDNGIARLAISPTSPYIVPQIKVANGDVFSMEANNITTKNIGAFQVKQFKLDFQKNTLEVEVNFPTLEPVADYVMKGSVLGIALDTAGKGLGTFKNLNIKSNLTGELVKKEGKEYLHFTEKEFDVTDIEDAYIYLYSLSADTNALINTQTKLFLKGMGPVTLLLKDVSDIFSRNIHLKNSSLNDFDYNVTGRKKL